MVEQCGFAGVLLPDHVVFPAAADTAHPIGHPTRPEDVFPDPLGMVIAMSAATTRIEFATYVYVLPMREPFTVAKQVATTAILSGDRFHFGIGVGWFREEFDLLRQHFGTRGARTDEMIDILRDFWDDGYAEHRGVHYSFDRCGMFPKPEQPVQIWVGGTSLSGMRRAARCDGAMPMNAGLDDASRLLAMLRDERAKLGKDPLDGRALIAVPGRGERLPAHRHLAEEGATDIVVFPWGISVKPDDARAPVEERRPALEAMAALLKL